jgi:hypothetical protein
LLLLCKNRCALLDVFHRRELTAVCMEQASAKGGFPGPVLVVWDGASAVEHVAEAAALGCAAVAVDSDDVGPDGAADVAGWAARLGLETVVRVASPAAAKAAAAAGAKIVCMGTEGAEEAEVKEAAAALGKDVVSVAHVTRKDDYSEVCDVVTRARRARTCVCRERERERALLVEERVCRWRYAVVCDAVQCSARVAVQWCNAQRVLRCIDPALPTVQSDAATMCNKAPHIAVQ